MIYRLSLIFPCNLLNEWMNNAGICVMHLLCTCNPFHWVKIISPRFRDFFWSFFLFSTASSRFEHIFTAAEISNLRNQAIWIMNNSIRSIIWSVFYLSSSQNQNSLVCLPLLNTAQNIVLFMKRRGSRNAQPGTNEWGYGCV